MTIIGIDVDDTAADLMTCWLRLYRIGVRCKHNLQKEDIKDWDIGQYVLPEYKNMIYRIIEDPYIYNNIKPIDGALEGYNYLKNKKDKNGNLQYDILFVTNSTIGCAGRKYDWLIENGFEVNHHNYIEMYRKDLLNVDIMIDDNFENISKTPGIGILFDAPWNKQYKWYPRANNWDEVISIIEGWSKIC